MVEVDVSRQGWLGLLEPKQAAQLLLGAVGRLPPTVTLA
jgi:hypothetical protein